LHINHAEGLQTRRLAFASLQIIEVCDLAEPKAGEERECVLRLAPFRRNEAEGFEKSLLPNPIRDETNAPFRRNEAEGFEKSLLSNQIRVDVGEEPERFFDVSQPPRDWSRRKLRA